MSGNRNKKNNKKSKSLNLPVQVKSVKLDTAKSTQESGKQSAKSDDNLRKRRKFNILKNVHNDEESVSEGGSQMDSSLMKKFKTLTLTNEGESSMPGTSLVSSLEEPNIDVKKTNNEDDIPLVMEYCPEPPQESFDDLTCYKYPRGSKSSKSIKFTNQVTVLYFNGEDILCESMEPLKKEQDQQLRNKEMRKEHLMSKGPIDNLYLF